MNLAKCQQKTKNIIPTINNRQGASMKYKLLGEVYWLDGEVHEILEIKDTIKVKIIETPNNTATNKNDPNIKDTKS